MRGAHLLCQLCDLIRDAVGHVLAGGCARIRAQHHAALVAGRHYGGLHTSRTGSRISVRLGWSGVCERICGKTQVWGKTLPHHHAMVDIDSISEG